MKILSFCFGLALLAGQQCAVATIADRFDYAIGNRDRYTEANDGDGWYDAQEFGEWNPTYSKYHLGEDWNAESGSDCGLPVYAVANGTIAYASIASGWGRVMIVRHTLPDGSQVESLYGHLGSFSKTSGDVARGEQIGTIGDGSEGGTTYPCHLHLEIRTAVSPNWGQPGPGYSATPKPDGWFDPSDFIDLHRQPAVGWLIKTYRNGSPVNGLADADALISGGFVISTATMAVGDMVGFSTGEGSGHFAVNNSVPGIPNNTATDNYAVQGTGFLIISATGQYTFGLNTDDGARLKIDGTSIIVDDVRSPPHDSPYVTVMLSAGSHSIEWTWYNEAGGVNGGGAEGEIFAAPGVHSGFDSSFQLVGTAPGLVVLPVPGAQYVLQPGPADSKDIWTTSVFSYADCSKPYPGGGQNDGHLRVGGWGDWYFSLLQFDLRGLPTTAVSAVLYLYCYNLSGGGTPMYLDRITQPWDWRTTGTGCDHDRLWWADRPATAPWSGGTLGTPSQGDWYAVDVTDLYLAWQNGTYANCGLEFRPVLNANNNFDEFYSADYTDDQTLRPKFVVTALETLAPTITMQPQQATTTAGTTVSFSVAASGAFPLNYQWRKNGVNIPAATSSALTVNSVGAADSAGYSVVVWNAYSSVVSATASLAVLTDGANGNRPSPISPSQSSPAQTPGVDSLVLVTHGFAWNGVLADDSWVSQMANAIQQRAPANWNAIPYIWSGQAWGTPGFALINATIQGGVYGNALGQLHYKHIHLIGHSAGAAFVEAAAKSIRAASPTTEIHSTFLDPYRSFLLTGSDVYGVNADWADCYFAEDGFGGFTSGGLVNAHNVDVSWVDPHREIVSYGAGQAAFSSHGYPCEFYLATITNTASTWCAADYGFALSEEREGNGWDSNPVNYPENNPPLMLCSLPGAVRNPNAGLVVSSALVSFAENAYMGFVNVLGNAAASLFSPSTPLPQSGGMHPLDDETYTNTPAWLALGLTITNPVNFVQFDGGFTDTNSAHGLLTVYWNTNQVGVVDERVASTNLQSYRFALPGTVANGLYTLSFRLDSFNGTSSSITITNVATCFVGVTQPITLGISLTNGAPLLQLTAASNYNYLVQSSTNLVDWTPAALLVNTNGSVSFADLTATNSSVRFYRALMP
jgi:murein DD-endopeptidase MepM/ murein hydrolase activator NlpD